MTYFERYCLLCTLAMQAYNIGKTVKLPRLNKKAGKIWKKLSRQDKRYIKALDDKGHFEPDLVADALWHYSHCLDYSLVDVPLAGNVASFWKKDTTLYLDRLTDGSYAVWNRLNKSNIALFDVDEYSEAKAFFDKLCKKAK